MAEKRSTTDQDRRKGPDLWLRLLTGFTVFGWMMMFVALIVLDESRPEVRTVIDELVGAHRRQYWDVHLARSIFYMMILGLVLSLFGLVINMKRRRRKNDTFRLSLILLGIVSLSGIVLYLNFF